MKLNTNAGPRTNRNILRRVGTIPDPRRTTLNRRYTGLESRGYHSIVSKILVTVRCSKQLAASVPFTIRFRMPLVRFG